ncbi:hypothetical protein SCATT_37420 [Streptantibioticus cattleyicolor NRRL 8057 = DSM 46488]|uniref:Uncharacterized protein n=1 Tax=Streptantibioticus cattleyicolor (strain ATCC 35852 / DSM 46488 / JCM 4925 / NBRC 14057 / NRRL 8057) TaxID=1003195 RepID=G8X2Y1_STREN|nr:hypothetical protein SCATT_37420 [Streptantibioticus cattleyicolor NRRL 8057 = DSM 46488]
MQIAAEQQFEQFEADRAEESGHHHLVAAGVDAGQPGEQVGQEQEVGEHAEQEADGGQQDAADAGPADPGVLGGAAHRAGGVGGAAQGGGADQPEADQDQGVEALAHQRVLSLVVPFPHRPQAAAELTDPPDTGEQQRRGRDQAHGPGVGGQPGDVDLLGEPGDLLVELVLKGVQLPVGQHRRADRRPQRDQREQRDETAERDRRRQPPPLRPLRVLERPPRVRPHPPPHPRPDPRQPRQPIHDRRLP